MKQETQFLTNFTKFQRKVKISLNSAFIFLSISIFIKISKTSTNTFRYVYFLHFLGYHGRNHMKIGFTTTYAVCVYPQSSLKL